LAKRNEFKTRPENRSGFFVGMKSKKGRQV